MKKMFSLKLAWAALKESFKGFSEHKVTKLSASLAYYTVFSLGPMLIVIIFLLGMILGKEAAEGSIYTQIQTFIGDDAAKQIQTIIKNASIHDKGGMAATIGIIALLVGATTVFGEIQDSINSIWGVKAKPKAGILKLVMSRLLSFGILASLGFLLLVSLTVTAAVEAIGNRLEAAFPDVTVIVIYIVNLVLTLVVTMLLFAVIFKVLPDIRIKWKQIWPGAFATSLLFLAGKFAISLYISKTDVGSTYGAAGSLVILILWIYYSSMILYFGAEFTRAYALHQGVAIVPSAYAVWDDKPAIAGASPGQATSRKRTGQESPRPAPGYAMIRATHKPEKMEKSGFGTVAVGLLLYFFNTSSSKAKSRNSP